LSIWIRKTRGLATFVSSLRNAYQQDAPARIGEHADVLQKFFVSSLIVLVQRTLVFELKMLFQLSINDLSKVCFGDISQPAIFPHEAPCYALFKGNEHRAEASADVCGTSRVENHEQGVEADDEEGRKSDDATAANRVSQLLHNIICLKDHLKCGVRNGKPLTGDDLIDHNKDAGIVHDLWNL
jgi:hypothetical protein